MPIESVIKNCTHPSQGQWGSYDIYHLHMGNSTVGLKLFNYYNQSLDWATGIKIEQVDNF